MTNDAEPVAGRPERLDPALLKLGAIMVPGAFLSALDTTIVAVAIHSVGEHFGSPLSTVHWVTAVYLLALCVSMPATGWAVERFGARRVWMTGLTIFLITSLLCATATSVTSLVVYRALQGLGGGMLAPVAQIILGRAAGPGRIGRIMTLVSVPTQMAPVLGPTVGGLLVETMGWRWIFIVNVPIVLIALVASWFGLPRETAQPVKRLDTVGMLLLAPGFAALIYGLSSITGSEEGSLEAEVTSPTVLLALSTGAVLLAAYVGHALRTRREPIIDIRIFANGRFAAAVAFGFCANVTMFSMTLLHPLYYQQVRGEGAFDAGLLLAPQSVGIVLALLVAGPLTDRLGPRTIAGSGILITILGLLAYTQVGTDTNEVFLAAVLLVAGLGIGTATVPMMTAIYQIGLPRTAIPRATSTLNVAGRVGGAFGTAVIAVTLQWQIARVSPGNAAADTAALAVAFGNTYWWIIAFSLVALIPLWFMPRRVVRSSPDEFTADKARPKGGD